MLKQNIAIHCNTYEESDLLLGILIEAGYNWSLNSIFGDTCWKSYKNKTCYCLSDSGNSIQYSYIDYFKQVGYKIIEFKEFIKNVD